MIAIPTTAGTGSEAQSLRGDFRSKTNQRWSCGDGKAAFRAAILDPKLTLSQPRALAASTGYDAISHAIETLVSTRRTALSDCFSRSAWRLLNTNFERMLKDPERSGSARRNVDRRALRRLGHRKFDAGRDPCLRGPADRALCDCRTASAIALLLSHVVEWNSAVVGRQYDELNAGDLARRLRELAETADLPVFLQDAAVPEEALPRLAEEAASQWTGKFNPRPLDAPAALEIYQGAF